MNRKIISLFTSLALIMSAVPVFAYPDCDSEAVTELTKWGVLSGDENGNFRPDDLLTRAEFSTMAAIATGVNDLKATDLPQESRFSDVGRDYWGFKYIVYSTNCAYLDGFEDGTFKPDENVTFAQAVKICLSASGYNAMIDKSVEPSTWYEPWLKIAYDYGLIDTTDENPDRKITREEAAEMIYTAVNMPLCIVKGYNVATGTINFRLCDGKEDENGEVEPFNNLYRKYIR
ncbi:MAG: S-layer homology domain-containing protein [Oscillospiraceae bacterium]|nr:S-layer homology domain-containing protein [Oscillospiraceae bacterium]